MREEVGRCERARNLLGEARARLGQLGKGVVEAKRQRAEGQVAERVAEAKECDFAGTVYGGNAGRLIKCARNSTAASYLGLRQKDDKHLGP